MIGCYRVTIEGIGRADQVIFCVHATGTSMPEGWGNAKKKAQEVVEDLKGALGFVWREEAPTNPEVAPDDS